VEYREIRYTVRTRIERNEWTVSIHPADIESPRRVVTGPRVPSELLARSVIDKWHERTARRANMNLTSVVSTQGSRVRLLRTSQHRSSRMLDGWLRLPERK
jgi:hypothetical protein